MGRLLEQIGFLLSETLSASELRGMFRLKHPKLEQLMKQVNHQIDDVAHRLNLIEQENEMSDYDVVVKTLPSQKVLSLREQLASNTEIDQLFSELAEVVEQHPIRSVGPWMALYHHEGIYSEDLDIEVVIPIEEDVAPITVRQG